MAKVNQRILSIPERSVQWTVHMLEHYNHHPDTPSDTRWSGAKDNSLLSLNRRRKHGSVVLARPATLTETYVPIILSCPWPLLVNYILNYDQCCNDNASNDNAASAHLSTADSGLIHRLFPFYNTFNRPTNNRPYYHRKLFHRYVS